MPGRITSALFSEGSVGVSGVNAGVGASGNLGESPDGPLKTPQATQESLMFHRPGQLAKSEHVLHIIYFVDKLVPKSDERTISEVGLIKLLVSYGPKKPKLKNITLSQWVVGNTRIFFTLLQLGTVTTLRDTPCVFVIQLPYLVIPCLVKKNAVLLELSGLLHVKTWCQKELRFTRLNFRSSPRKNQWKLLANPVPFARLIAFLKRFAH